MQELLDTLRILDLDGRSENAFSVERTYLGPFCFVFLFIIDKANIAYLQQDYRPTPINEDRLNSLEYHSKRRRV